nr:hypothetical protein [Tanacetum cinerariifolium]
MTAPSGQATANIREASYYQEYLENVVKHRWFLAGEPARKPNPTAQKEKSENKGRVPTEMELELEHTQQGPSYEVSVAVCFSLRSLKSKRTIESRAKRSSKIISLGHDSTFLASSHTVKSKTDIKSPTHYPCGIARTSEWYVSNHSEDGNPARANIKQALVDIEKVAVCFSLRSLKSKRTIESRAKRSSKIISLGHDSTFLASSHTVKSKTDIKSPTHYPCGIARTSEWYVSNHSEDGNPARANIKQALGRVRPDATGRMSLSVIIKCTAAIRQFAYGTTPDAFDEYLQTSERTARDSLTNFNKCIISLYMAEYLRKPTLKDVENVYNKHLTTHGFPGTLGSIDCMHWKWKNCPVSWQGQYGRGDKKYPTIMLEAVASQDLWIWHVFFGITGANNDINVLDNSPLFDDILNDTAPVVSYVVNGVGYEKWYYLVDGIYPQWATFVNLSRLQMTRNMLTLKSIKKVHGKMTNVLLVFSKDVGE